jgi:hypothetical protein
MEDKLDELERLMLGETPQSSFIPARGKKKSD